MGLAEQVTDEILATMERQGVSKADLARRLDMSRANVTQLLSGDRNMTLGTLARIASVLNNHEPVVRLVPATCDIPGCCERPPSTTPEGDDRD